jgi:hypothetical protein
LFKSIQSSANNERSQAPLTWDAINKMASSYGAPYIDYDRFAARFETDDVLKSLVDRFDGSGVLLKTNVQPGSEAEVDGESNSESEVSKMADHAMSKSRFNK